MRSSSWRLRLLCSCRLSLAFPYAMPLPDETLVLAELFLHQFVLWSALTTAICLPQYQWVLRAKAMYFLEIPIKDISSDDKHAKTTMRVPMVLPHELLNYLIAAWWKLLKLFLYVESGPLRGYRVRQCCYIQLDPTIPSPKNIVMISNMYTWCHPT